MVRESTANRPDVLVSPVLDGPGFNPSHVGHPNLQLQQPQPILPVSPDSFVPDKLVTSRNLTDNGTAEKDLNLPDTAKSHIEARDLPLSPQESREGPPKDALQVKRTGADVHLQPSGQNIVLPQRMMQPMPSVDSLALSKAPVRTTAELRPIRQEKFYKVSSSPLTAIRSPYHKVP